LRANDRQRNGPAVLLPHQQTILTRAAKYKEHAISEKGESAFRDASIDAGEMTLWVKGGHGGSDL
jgi:hypothetical protein